MNVRVILLCLSPLACIVSGLLIFTHPTNTEKATPVPTAIHWASAPLNPELTPPAVRSRWLHNGIDAFILQRLLQAGIAPTSEADCYTLIRRASLDLTGLPPSLLQADSFCTNPAPNAFEQLVDSLLATPQYGEQMAAAWLIPGHAASNQESPPPDAAQWQQRDWFVSAFNANKSLNQLAFADEATHYPDVSILPTAPSLEARVTVNRMWALFLGSSLISNIENTDAEEIDATNLALLEWLSSRLVYTHEWALKPLVKDLITSSTYRQKASNSQRVLKKDPDNLLLARKSPVPLPEAILRDQHLYISGLLVDRTFHTVLPSQKAPPLWYMPADSIIRWQRNHHHPRYLRSLYNVHLHTRPIALPLKHFENDACTFNHMPMKTSITLLPTSNERIHQEAARALAGRMAEAGGTPWNQLQHGYRLALISPPDENAMHHLSTVYNDALQRYYHQSTEIRSNITGPNYPPTVEQAALVQVAATLMRLDAYLVK